MKEKPKYDVGFRLGASGHWGFAIIDADGEIVHVEGNVSCEQRDVEERALEVLERFQQAYTLTADELAARVAGS